MALDIVRHDYNGLAIPQRPDDGYVSLTAMAQAERKNINDYMRLKNTKEYLAAFSDESGIPVFELIQVFQGSIPPNVGTWAHPEIAIDFAQWLSVRFRIWANRTLRQAIAGEIPTPHISQLLPGLVMLQPSDWKARFPAEWRSEAERLTGWTWGSRCMYRFVNRCTYDWFPQEVRDELDRVNPVLDGVDRKNRLHQHLKGEALEILEKQIERSYHLMIASTSLPQFEQAIDQAMTRRYQLFLKLA